MNDADRAQAWREQFEQLSISALRKANAPKATGRCLYCAEPLANGVLFCDSDCRDDFERLQQRQARA